MSGKRERGWQRAGATLLLTLGVLLVGGCGGQAGWQTRDVRGLVEALRFHGEAEPGDHPVDAADYRGDVVLMYFGYTHCPDVCPLTLAKLAAALTSLGDAARQVRVLFVSVDPRRDTAPVLARYVAAFGPQFVGLRVDADELQRLARRYRIAYSYATADADGNYDVSHSSAVFIFDGQGRARLLGTQNNSPAQFAADLQRLLQGH